MRINELLKTDTDEILLSWLLNKPREYLIVHSNRAVSASELKKFRAARSKIENGWPVAYVVGFRWFYGEKFRVSRATLIPRPETEMLVERALNIAVRNKPDLIADIGTGSGAIIVSLAKQLLNGLANANMTAATTSTSAQRGRPKLSFPQLLATDISAAALAVARTNTKNILKKQARAITFKRGNLLAPINRVFVRQNKAESGATAISTPKASKNSKINTLILANLPYLASSELREPSISREPRTALYGGKNGTEIIEQLLAQAAEVLSPVEANVILLEAHYNQARRIKSAVKKLWRSRATVRIIQDYSGFNRIYEVSIAPKTISPRETTSPRANFSQNGRASLGRGRGRAAVPKNSRGHSQNRSS